MRSMQDVMTTKVITAHPADRELIHAAIH